MSKMMKRTSIVLLAIILAFQCSIVRTLADQTLHPNRRGHVGGGPERRTLRNVAPSQHYHQSPLLATAVQSAAGEGQVKLRNFTPLAAATKLDQPATKSCTPILKLDTLFAGRPTVGKDPTSGQDRLQDDAAGPNSSGAALDKFSFAIGDIDMPVAATEGSLGSAIKLLSSFGGQFEPASGPAIEADVQDLEGEQNVVKFRDNHLQIQGLNLTMLNVHLFPDNEPKFGVGILIRNTTLRGRFTYNGPLQLAGFYRMHIDNIYLVASSNLTRHYQVAGEPIVELGGDGASVESGAILKTNDFKMNITNLGFISIDILDSQDSNKPTTNYLLRMLQRLLQKTIKRTYYSFEGYIRETLESESRRSLDCELTRFTHLLGEVGSQNYLAKILSSEITRSHLDTVPLPEFAYQQQLFGSGASVQFHNGSLSGLANIKLNGETKIKLLNEHLLVNTSIGWTDLRPYYNWELLLGSSSKTPTAKGFVLFNVREVDFDAVIAKGLSPHTNIVVEQLVIRRLDSPKMDINGLPGMNRVTRAMVNFFMGRLKQRLAMSIQPALRQQLEKSLNKMNFLF